MLRPPLVFWLLVRIFVRIMAFFITIVELNLTQIYFDFFVFLNGNGINFNNRGIRRFTLWPITQIRIFLWRTQSLTGLVFIFTIPLISAKRRLDLLCLIIFLVFILFAFHYLIAPRAIRIALYGKQRGLTIFLGLGMNAMLNNLFLTILVSIWFI